MALRLPDLMVASSSKSSSKDRHAFAFPWSKGKRVAAATANEAPTPKPGIRVSSLGTSRRPGSLQRSLSSPASLRSLSLWHEAVSQQAEPLPSLDCVVGPSRYVEVERPGEGAERLAMPPDHSSYYSSADYWASTVAEEPLEPPNQLFVSPTMTHSDSRGSFRTAQEEEEDDLELAEDPYATLLGLGVALNELPAVLVDPSVTSPHPAAATERETTAAVEVVVSADARLSIAVDALARLQESAAAAVGSRHTSYRRTQRRSISMPALPQHTPRSSLDASRPPSSPRRWQAALGAIVRPQPELPPREGDNDATTADSDGEEEADPRLLLRLAIDDVRTAQAALLACLCETAAVFGLPLTHLYEQRVLLAAQSLLASELGTDAFDATLQHLRGSALRTCEALEQVREAAHSLAPKRPTLPSSTSRRSRLRVSGIGLFPPVAPQRESSLPAAVKSTPDYRTLAAALAEWNIAYSTFAQAWTSHQLAARDARQAARVARRERRTLITASTFGLSPTSATAEGLGPILSTSTLVSAALTRALCDGLLTTREARNLEPIVFCVVPRLAILFGCVGAILPADWEREGSNRPLAIFLPRICRGLPNATVRAIRGLEEEDLESLASLLACTKEDGKIVGGYVRALYTDVAAVADRASLDGKKSWGKVMRRCLQSWAEEEDVGSVFSATS